jgi:hypothetical protein
MKRKRSALLTKRRPGRPPARPSKSETLARKLEFMIHESGSGTDPIVEQLRQCPEAFKAGRILEEALGSQAQQSGSRAALPAGTVMSPFV